MATTLVVCCILSSCYGFASTNTNAFKVMSKVHQHSNAVQQKRAIPLSRLFAVDVPETSTNESGLIGDDSAAFSFEEQVRKIKF